MELPAPAMDFQVAKTIKKNNQEYYSITITTMTANSQIHKSLNIPTNRKSKSFLRPNANMSNNIK